MSAQDRAGIMRRLHGLMVERADDLANLITQEVGAPILFSHFGQIGATHMALDFFTGLTESYPFEEVRAGMLGPVVVRKEPVGVVAGIVPWNVPLFITMLKFAPTLASGSTMVLKSAPETPVSAFVFAELCEEAGVPAGVLNVVPADREVGEHLVTHPGVDKVSFTGSTAAGRHIGALCGERLRRCTLELGGKSASILMEDADIAAAVTEMVPNYSFMNNGQACVAQTRILAPRSRYDETVDAVTEVARSVKVGDPADFEVGVGPLIAERQRDRVLGSIDKGKNEGARITTGGPSTDQAKGWFVEPTVFGDVENGMTIAQEEIFGPVLSVIAHDGVDDAVAIANDSDYGLCGTVWGADSSECAGLDVARGVRTGTYTVNGFGMDWGSPFGGFKDSASAASWDPRASRSTWSTSRSTCRPAPSPSLRF